MFFDGMRVFSSSNEYFSPIYLESAIFESILILLWSILLQYSRSILIEYDFPILIYFRVKSDMDSIIEEVESKKDEYEIIKLKRDVDKEVLDKALIIVKDFISERNLVLYGGIAIDYALRLKGTSIYSDDQTPDYDCLSTTHVEDAYDLAEKLYNAGFKDINAVRGIHVQTMRVFVDKQSICDISYCPKIVYDTLEWLQYKTLKIQHPNFQRIDMHLSLSFPFANPPNVVIFHRWKKDIQRFNMFEEYYSITAKNTLEIATSKTFKLPKKILGKCAVHGLMAYELLRRALEYTIKEMKSDNKEIDMSILPKIDMKITDNGADEIQITIPDEKLGLLTPEPDAAIKELGISNVSRYNKYMDWIPEVYETSDFSIFSTEGSLLSISVLESTIESKAIDGKGDPSDSIFESLHHNT